MLALKAASSLRAGLLSALPCAARAFSVGTMPLLKANSHFYGGGRTVYMRTNHSHESDAALRHLRWILSSEGVVVKKQRETRRFPPGQSVRLRERRRLMQFYLRYLQERTNIVREAEFREYADLKRKKVISLTIFCFLRILGHFWRRKPRFVSACSARCSATTPTFGSARPRLLLLHRATKSKSITTDL